MNYPRGDFFRNFTNIKTLSFFDLRLTLDRPLPLHTVLSSSLYYKILVQWMGRCCCMFMPSPEIHRTETERTPGVIFSMFNISVFLSN
jgi:hypothetical protein